MSKDLSADNADNHFTDFGRMIYKQPTKVIYVCCTEDVCRAMKMANDLKTHIAIRGAGHSCNGQTLTNGIQIINCVSNDESQIKLLDDGLVLVPTRITWDTLEKMLNRHQRSCPVLTNFLSTTVGGTLSVGGIGVNSLEYGAQVDQVVKLKLILPTGDILWCSENENAELFKFSLANMGSLGVIESVVLKTIPYYPFSTVHSHSFPLTSLIEGLNEFIGVITHQNSQSWAELKFDMRMKYFLLEYGSVYSTEKEFLSLRQKNKKLFNKNSKNVRTFTIKEHQFKRFESIKVLKEEVFTGKNLWCDYVLKSEQAIEFLEYIDEMKITSPLFKNLKAIYFLPIKRPEYSPEIPLHPAPIKNTLYISIGLLFSVSPEENELEKAILETKSVLNLLLTRCLKLNGRPYLYGANNLNATTNRLIFPEHYEQLLKLKRTYDPNDIICLNHLWKEHQR